MSKALVLLSGGLDSSLCATLAVDEFGEDNVITLTINYGQKHSVEVAAAKKVSKELGIKEHLLRTIRPWETPEDSEFTLLNTTRDVPEEKYGRGPLSTYVPFRNGLLLSIATGVAYMRECEVVLYGAHLEDSFQGAYPDTTPEFNGAMANAVFSGTNGKVRLVTPLQWMTKKEIVQEAYRNGVPIDYTYSCYNGRELHCGRCSTCKARIEAFKLNGLVDTVEYEIDIDWGDEDYIINLEGRD